MGLFGNLVGIWRLACMSTAPIFSTNFVRAYAFTAYAIPVLCKPSFVGITQIRLFTAKYRSKVLSAWRASNLSPIISMAPTSFKPGSPCGST